MIYFIVVQLLSHVQFFVTHVQLFGLQQGRLPCPSYLLEFVQTYVH